MLGQKKSTCDPLNKLAVLQNELKTNFKQSFWSMGIPLEHYTGPKYWAK